MKIIILLLFFSIVNAQQLSISDLSKLSGQRISNSQLEQIKSELQNNQNDSKKINQSVATEIPKVEITPPDSNLGNSPFFGYKYFERQISFFDNSPTPSDYRLGPGDEVMLSIWGQQNLRETFVITKDGLIFYNNIGFINISNLTLDEAEKVLSEELSSIYSSIKDKDNPTKLMVQLGKLKSINVYFTGLVSNPGVHLVHPFSDVFAAIIQAGGVSQDGSLRNINIIRNNKVLTTVDFYNFFVKGINDFSDLRLIDGDIIHIPPVKNRNEISGEVIYKGFFELKENETISDLISYAGGYNTIAGQSAILDLILPQDKRTSDDNARDSINLSSEEYDKFSLNNGDKVTILPISSVNSKVTVLGNVKNPRSFSANSTLREVLNLAGGFEDPVFRKTILEDSILILRKDESNYYSKEFVVSYNNSDKFKLEPGDTVFVYENVNYKNIFTFSISGEVQKPGTFPFSGPISVRDAIKLAGGFTDQAFPEALTLSGSFINTQLSMDSKLSNINLDTKITQDAKIFIPKLTNSFLVQGNVYSPGLVAINSSVSIKNAVKMAGGLKPNSLKNKIYIRRANGKIIKPNFVFRNMTRLNIGDTLIVPLDEKDPFDITTFIADLSVTLANIAAILILVDNSNN